MMLFYHFLVCTGFLLALPALPVVWLVSEKRRANLIPDIAKKRRK